jgi:cell division protein FtsZ
VQGISDIITIPGIINRDFADVKTTMAGMGHAVMGTAIRSGENRAVEAAQAAMASPLLEEGAIDGARGILINITGSSTLKLSEVNAASTLIQTSAHEDANIIFGAVLDEKMGDDVKITVIATGFRDQMPERRSRMLDVEAMPVVSVPVVAPNQWMKDAAPVAETKPTRNGLRFMSEVEEESHAPVAVAAASVVAKPEPAQPVTQVAAVSEPVKETSPLQEFGGRFAHEPEAPVAPVTPRFAELSEAPTYAPLPRDYATEVGPHRTEETRPVGLSQFGQAQDPDHTDLDVPAFLRRGQF